MRRCSLHSNLNMPGSLNQLIIWFELATNQPASRAGADWVSLNQLITTAAFINYDGLFGPLEQELMDFTGGSTDSHFTTLHGKHYRHFSPMHGSRARNCELLNLPNGWKYLISKYFMRLASYFMRLASYFMRLAAYFMRLASYFMRLAGTASIRTYTSASTQRKQRRSNLARQIRRYIFNCYTVLWKCITQGLGS